MLSPLALVKAGLGAASGTFQGEQRFAELHNLLPLYVAHFASLRTRLALSDDAPLLRRVQICAGLSFARARAPAPDRVDSRVAALMRAWRGAGQRRGWWRRLACSCAPVPALTLAHQRTVGAGS